MSYGIRSKDYLFRANQLLAENTIPSLFYAAFEIRCGIEMRMSEYLEAQTHISEKKKSGWQVAKLAKNLEQAFRLGEKTAVIEIIDPNSNELILKTIYTPVRKKGRDVAQKLGDYLHKAKKYHPDDDQYWSEFRRLLNDGIAELEFSNSGDLLGPPIQKLKTNQYSMSMEGGEEILELLNGASEILMSVHYE
ncbi:MULTISPECIES: hypothetical protein [Marinomonas]|uniref:Uncharacterized protein n=1 Tax=Marinomonas rhodophyticola TaxID=2992803 RepID=A0ABT3KHW5_9GAMM|nr:hypothetical protein [Marinomonas sp. KJ51-3]MCW4629672.1 hypothetical protein [Marinomonas sp. KJ51-3]